MSSKRGRKRNDTLPPSRARDVQRAFRARRAAHLEALEDRVAVLEQENSLLRAALNLPPSERPVLGRGPTGKEKPKSSLNSELPLADSLRRASVSTISTEASNVSQSRSPAVPSSTSPHDRGDQTMQSFAFPAWDNALMMHEDMVDSDGSSPSAEGHPPPPLKLSPVSFPTLQPFPLRPTDTSGVVSPDSMHSRSNSYSQSSSASSAGADAFSPGCLYSEISDDSPTFAYSAPQNHSSHQQHLSPSAPYSHLQYSLSSPSSAGADQTHTFLNHSRESDRVLNISHPRHSPQQARTGAAPPSINGHRRAITEPQTLRALVMQNCSSMRGSAPQSAHPIRVPSPPPVPVIDREAMARKYSLV